MSQNSNTQPYKSILKHPGSKGQEEAGPSRTSGDKSSLKPCESKATLHAKFDESNIQKTLHPADKDYGLMKIDEPKTPFSNYQEPVDESNSSEKRSSLDGPQPKGLDASLLSKMLLEKGHEPPKSTINFAKKDEKDEFEARRKAHYDEFQVTKLAKASGNLDETDGEEDALEEGQARSKISRHRDSSKLVKKSPK